MKYNSFGLLIMVGVLIWVLLPLCSSAGIGTFQKDTQIDLYQTCNNCTYCNLTSVKYPNSSNIVTNVVMTKTDSYYNYTLSSSETNVLGTYKYCYVCGNAIDTATGCIDFEVTYTGEKLSLSHSIIVLVFIILSGIFLFLSYSFNKEHWLMRTFFNFFSMGAAILAINSARIIVSESENLGKMGNTGLTLGIVVLSIFFLYMFIYSFIEIIKVFKEKKGVRWQY